MELLKFNDFKKQLQKLYNFKAKEEREILYSCQIKNDPVNSLGNFTEDLKQKRKNSIFTDTESMRSANKKLSDIGVKIAALTKSKENFYLEILYINGDNIIFPYAVNIQLLHSVQVSVIRMLITKEFFTISKQKKRKKF